MNLDKEAKRELFLAHVKDYIATDPEAAAHVSNYVQAGLCEALSKSNARAADMEVALAAVVSKKYKGSEKILLSKLEKWEGKTALDWSWLIDRLKEGNE